MPYRGGSQAVTGVIGKHIDFIFDTPTLLLEQIRGGQLRAVAVTGKERFFALPDVPTIGETVVGYETSREAAWVGQRPLPTTPAAFKERVAADVAEWTKVATDGGLKRTGAQ